MGTPSVETVADHAAEPAADAVPSDARGRQAAPPGGPWSKPYRRATAGLLITIAAGAFEVLAIGTIMPATVDDLGGLELYGWAFSAYLLANLLGLVIAGSEADHRGPSTPFFAGATIFAAGLLIGGLAPSMLVLIAARALQGFGVGLVSSVAYVVVGRGYPESGRPQMLALMSTAWVVPGLVGPGLAGVIADEIGWRWVFLGIVPLVALAALLSAPTVRTVPPGSLTAREWSRILRAALLAIGMALLLAGFGQSRLVLAIPLALAGAALTARLLPSLLPNGTMRARPGLPAAIITMGLLNLAFFGTDTFVPLALTDVRDTSTSFAGLALTAATLTWSAGSWIQAQTVRRIGARRLIRIGLAILSGGVALTVVVVATEVPVLLAPVSWAVAGLGIGLAYSALSLVVLEAAPAGQEGSATSAMQIANVVGGAVATGVGGVVISGLSSGAEASAESVTAQFALMIAVLFLALLTAGRLPALLGRGSAKQSQST